QEEFPGHQRRKERLCMRRVGPEVHQEQARPGGDALPQRAQQRQGLSKAAAQGIRDPQGHGEGGKEVRDAPALAEAKATFEQRDRRGEVTLAQCQDAGTVIRVSSAECASMAPTMRACRAPRRARRRLPYTTSCVRACLKV